MKSKTTLITAIIATILCALGLVAAFAVKSSYISLGIENISHVDDLKKMHISIEYVWGQSGEGLNIISDFLENGTFYEDELEDSEYVFVVVPTGELHQFRGSFSQTAQILQILKAPKNEITVGDTVVIFQNGGFYAHEQKIIFNQTSNIMYPENYYLVHLNESELNSTNDPKSFYFFRSIFSCINLLHREDQQECTNNDFNSNQNNNQFCISPDLLDAFMRIEGNIILKYGIHLDRLYEKL